MVDHQKDVRPMAPTPISPAPLPRWYPPQVRGSGAPPFMRPDWSRRKDRQIGTHSPY